MGAWHQDRLADWLSVVMRLWLWLWIRRTSIHATTTIVLLFCYALSSRLRKWQQSELLGWEHNQCHATNSTKPSPSWEATSRSATQEFISILWNSKAHRRVHKTLPPVPMLSQISPVSIAILSSLVTSLSPSLSGPYLALAGTRAIIPCSLNKQPSQYTDPAISFLMHWSA
jgi:hypothetical protein